MPFYDQLPHVEDFITYLSAPDKSGATIETSYNRETGEAKISASASPSALMDGVTYAALMTGATKLGISVKGGVVPKLLATGGTILIGVGAKALADASKRPITASISTPVSTSPASASTDSTSASTTQQSMI